MTNLSYDSLWDQQLQRAYKAGTRSVLTNRQKASVAPPRPQDLLRLPAEGSGAHKGLEKAGMALLAAGKLGVLHLNGGLGTRFGQMKAACPVASFSGKERSFLELKIGHVRWVQKTHGGKVFYCLMNSPMTQELTEKYLWEMGASVIASEAKQSGGHDGIAAPPAAARNDEGSTAAARNDITIRSFMQGVLRRKVPNKADLGSSAAKEILDWVEGNEGEFVEPAQYAPGGHFDAAACLISSGMARRMIEAGVEYLQVSNIDNLAATLDPAILGLLASRPEGMFAEVAIKKPGDKGGVPIRWNDEATVLLEEFALPKGFDGDTVRQFNTATYWMKLDSLLGLFGVDAKGLGKISAKDLEKRVRDVRAKIPAYVVLKKLMLEDGREVLAQQDEQLLGDCTRLHWEVFGRSAGYLVIDTDKRFIPIKTQEDLSQKEAGIRKVLEGRVLL